MRNQSCSSRLQWQKKGLRVSLLLSQHFTFFMNARELRRTLEEHLNEKAEEIERLKGAFTCGICVTEVFSRALIAGFFGNTV